MQHSNWERINRKTVYDSKFLKVYEDHVRLPNGKELDDYTVVEKPSIVMIVATDTQNKLIVLQEYKYAAGEVMRVVPAGHKKPNESPIAAAKRELLEETGYGKGSFALVGTLRDYPTKDLHTVYVVRVRDAEKIGDTNHEETETIHYELLAIPELKKQILNKGWKSSSALAAITVSGILF